MSTNLRDPDSIPAKTRYRERERLRRALVRVMEVFADNRCLKIPPDEATAVLAWEVAKNLVQFTREFGLKVPDTVDLTPFVNHKKRRAAETLARKRRTARARANGKSDQVSRTSRGS
jgi:hypothetical protein